MSKEQDALDTAKGLCKEGESTEDHELHREKLEQAYAAFSPSESNPAAGLTSLTASVVAQAEQY